MGSETMDIIIKVVIPVILAFVSGGGLVAYFKYRQEKPQANADVIVTFANGWEKYASKLEARLDLSDKRISELTEFYEKKIEILTLTYDQKVEAKDRRIRDLENRVEILEDELHKYQTIETKTEVAREDLHASVDTSIDQLKDN